MATEDDDAHRQDDIRQAKLESPYTVRQPQKLYEPLPTSAPHMRLLTVREIDARGHPLCSLDTCRLGACAFTALSYAWGPPPATRRILVNGSWRCIRSNLYDFLVSDAAKRYVGTPLFIDALCINQGDIAEKEAQVALMGRIFSSASQVVLWSPPRLSLKELAWIQGARRVQTLEEAVVALQRGFYENARGAFDERDMNTCADMVTQAFASNPVWNRLWVVQEAILAQRLVVQLGDYAVDLELFELLTKRTQAVRLGLLHDDDVTHLGGISQYAHRSARRISHTFTAPPQPLLMLGWRRKSRQSGAFNAPPLYALIVAFNDFESSIRHDRVYGMLGMSETHVRVDYKTSLTDLFLHVFIEGLRAIDAQPWDAAPERGSFDMQNFLCGMMNAFELSPADLSVYVVCRLAFESSAPRLRRVGFTFHMLWSFELSLRPYPLLERWAPLGVCLALGSSVQAQWPSVVGPTVARSYSLRRRYWLARLRRGVLHATMRLCRRFDVRLGMLDGTTSTISEWERRVREIGESVARGTTPPPPPPARAEHQRQSRSRYDFSAVGEIADLAFVLTLSLLLAWLGAGLGRSLDAFLDVGDYVALVALYVCYALNEI